MSSPLDQLRELVAVHVDGPLLHAAETDRSGLVGTPLAVARPRTADEVASVLAWAHRHGVPVVPRGAGTGRVGGAVPERGGVVLDLAEMNRIVEIDRRERIARVQPGVLLGDLQRAVAEMGLFFPPDPASARECMVGGAVATSAGGLRGAKYGTMKHYVSALDVVLADGTRIRTGARTRKCVTGYDLCGLFVGSEGTLGVFTEITLRLIPAPEARATLVAWFDDEATARLGVDAALDVPATAAALEYVDRRALAAVAAYTDDARMAERAGMILVECDGSAAAVEQELTAYADALRAVGADVERARDEASAERLWDARRSISPAVTARWPHRFAEDVCVPRTRFVEMIERLHAVAAEHGLSALGFGHAGDGNVHASVLLPDGSEESLERGRVCVAEVFRTALALGGTLSAEHGIAMTKREFLPLELSPENRAAQVAVKRALDPRDILNPGKIFPGT